MENNLINQTLFFSQYWGQKVACRYNSKRREYLEVESLLFACLKGEESLENWYLDLIPIQDISVLDALEIAEMCSKNDNESIRFLETSSHYDSSKKNLLIVKIKYKMYRLDIPMYSKPVPFTIHITNWGTINVYRGDELSNNAKACYIMDYLRAKRYALPFRGMTIEKLNEYKWLNFKKK